ncbi:MAG: type II CRISPR RNA-guided endonuclease Cas9 [Deltaproteobacteria bacterium]|nr:type II CRISPR RNA-guided endonuclease Cas9 [Deltaproteobacteria bacterium]
MTEEIKILGLDIGPNSVGWALIGCVGTSDAPGRLIDAGVRVFAEGVDRTPQGLEQSKNAARRMARSARRVHQRRNRRKASLKAVLQKAGLLPVEADALAMTMKEDPYALRATGIKEKLEPFQVGRALYHIAQRRGFKSNRKSEKSKDDGDVQKGIDSIRDRMIEAGSATLGEYLAKGRGAGERIRGQYTHRGMYEDEFNRLWERQGGYHPAALTEAARKDAHNAVFFQRHYDIRERWGKDLEGLPKGANAHRAPELGPCEYEKDEKRSPRATWHAQRFRLLQKVNDLRVTDTETGEIRGLEPAERAKLIDGLGQKKELPFDEMRKLLGLSASSRFNHEGGKNKKLKGNSTEWNLRVALKKGYDGLNADRADRRDEMITALIEEEDEDRLLQKAEREWGLDKKAAERLVKSRLEGGYLHLSVKALKRLLPFLEEGKDYMAAVEAAGYERKDQRGVCTKGKLLVTDLPTHTNPLVGASLHQVRKVVNAVVRTYGGAPHIIRVELIRELKADAERREEMIWEQRDNEKINNEAKRRLTEEFGVEDPTGEDVLRLRLWEECKRECPYTGRPIPKEALLDPEAVEVEHIIPHTRSLNNSYMNKTLCWTGENRAKSDKTPWEFYSHDEDRWHGIIKRASRLPDKKKERFFMKEVPDDFISRQLNDTAYIAREARSLLEKVSGKDNVQAATGGSTAEMRRLWGLNSVLGGRGAKNRDDHRHHAVDAIVVALTTHRILKEVSAASKRGRRIRDFPAPWHGFRDEVKEKMTGIVVSHRVRRKVSGPLHEETNYGKLKKKNEKGYPLYANRKSLQDLKPTEMEKIADKNVREVIVNHLKAHGVDLEAKGCERTPMWKMAMGKDNPPYMPNRKGARVPIKKVRLHRTSGVMIDLGYRAVEPGKNHHVVIFEHTEGKKKGQWDGDVVSLFEAARRLEEARRGKTNVPVIRRDVGEGKRFVMSLSIGDMVRIGAGTSAQYWKVQKMDANKQIALRPQTYAGKVSDSDRFPLILRKNPKTLGEIEGGCVKITVDPLGRVTEAHD